jgi:hypothetical protein
MMVGTADADWGARVYRGVLDAGGTACVMGKAVWGTEFFPLPLESVFVTKFPLLERVTGPVDLVCLGVGRLEEVFMVVFPSEGDSVEFNTSEVFPFPEFEEVFNFKFCKAVVKVVGLDLLLRCVSGILLKYSCQY